MWIPQDLAVKALMMFFRRSYGPHAPLQEEVNDLVAELLHHKAEPERFSARRRAVEQLVAV